jgi:hypothetical protein
LLNHRSVTQSNEILRLRYAPAQNDNPSIQP